MSAQTYTVKQVADILGYSTNSIYTFLKEKRVKGVRVGKGRFRIPQSEIDRLLSVSKSKNNTSLMQSAPGALTQSDGAFVASPSLVADGASRIIVRIDNPSLFHWFGAVTSILVGISLSLFSRVHEEYAVEQYAVWLPFLRTLLIAGGIGLIIADLSGKAQTLWQRLFTLSVAAGFMGYAAILATISDWEGLFVFGILGALLLLSLIVSSSGVFLFIAYILNALSSVCLVAILVPKGTVLSSFLSLPETMKMQFAGAWFVVTILVAFLFWIGYARHRTLLWAMVVITGIGFCFLALSGAAMLSWGRTVVFLCAGVFACYLPIWQSLTFRDKRDRALIIGTFSLITGIFASMLGVVRMAQSDILSYVREDLDNKVVYGKMYITQSLHTTKAAMEAVAAHPNTVTAIEKKDAGMAVAMLKTAFVSSEILDRVVLVPVSKTALSVYPLGETIVDASIQETMKRAVESRETRIIQGALVPTDKEPGRSIVIAAPVFGGKKQNEVIGVVLGYLDIPAIGASLQKIGSPRTEEAFTIVDAQGRRLIAPNDTQIASRADDTDPVVFGMTKGRGVTQSLVENGRRMLTAYDSIDELTWGIAIQAPIRNILGITNSGIIAVIAASALSFFISLLLLVSHRIRFATHVGEERREEGS